MENIRKLLITCVSILLFVALACQAASGVSDLSATAVQQTVEAAAQQGGTGPAGGLQPISPADLTATSVAAAAVAANQTPTSTATGNQPTATTQTQAQAPTPVPPTATSIPCDKVSFVKDVTIPDDTKLTPGSAFTKTWRLKNAGSCPWTSGYKLVFDRGDAMAGPQEVQLTTGSVAPGQTIDVSVNLTAPAKDGTYQGFWKLRNPSGVLFGWGDKSDSAFWVKIKVEAAAQQPPASSKKQVTLSATANGGSVDPNGLSLPIYIPGDDIADLSWTSFMEFSIVDIPSGATINAATLDLSCAVRDGTPFADLGPVGVFYSYYGNFDPAVLSQGNFPLTEHLGTVNACPGGSLNVTASLQANLGPPYYQIAVLFQFGTDSNADDDFIEVTAPTLKVEYTP